MSQITYETIYENDFNNISNTILNIIHFNDVYNIQSHSTEPKAGASRFLTAINHLKQTNNSHTLVLFSGDAFSPSSLSFITKGTDMVPCLNKFSIKAACIGNHDFDFGVEILENLIKETNFPWLISNVMDIKTNKPLANSNTKVILNENGLKLGIIGLVEQEWIETLATLKMDDVIYESFVTCGKRLAKELKEIDKVDYVIALTHMRLPNDIKLANETDNEIDIILGGHDHNYVHRMINNKWIIKSGNDFRNLTNIQIRKNDLVVSNIRKYTIDSSVIEDDELKVIVDKYSNLEDKEMYLDVLAICNIDLDSRFTIVRTQESNIANLICDILLESITSADCCILNSGTFRSDCVNEAGSSYTVGDLKKLLPSLNSLVLIECTGKLIHEALENGVSSYPKLEGRFPQVSNLSFEFDPSKDPNKRIKPESIKVKNSSLILDQTYKVLVTSFIKSGKDGYSCLEGCKVLIAEYQFPLFFTIIENYFRKNRSLNENFSIEPKIEQRIVRL